MSNVRLGRTATTGPVGRVIPMRLHGYDKVVYVSLVPDRKGSLVLGSTLGNMALSPGEDVSLNAHGRCSYRRVEPVGEAEPG